MFRVPRSRPKLVRPSLRRARLLETGFQVPDDPRRLITGPLDPELERVRVGLRPHRRRLWVRRIVRRAWIVLAAAVGLELLVFLAGRIWPIEGIEAAAATVPIVMLVVLALVSARARPSLGETAIAVDGEARLGDRLATALALGGTVPEAAGPPTAEDEALMAAGTGDVDDADERRRFVRRQRRDAMASLRLVPANLFRPRMSNRPAVAVLALSLALVPTLFLPNPQTAAIAQNRAVRE